MDTRQQRAKGRWIKAKRTGRPGRSADGFVQLVAGTTLALGTLLLGLAPMVARADDIDIYRTLPPDAKLLTILSLDLGADPSTVLCNNVLTDPATTPGLTLTEVSNCTAVRRVLTLDGFIQSLGTFLPTTALNAIAALPGVSGQLTQTLDTVSPAVLATLASYLAPNTGPLAQVNGGVVNQLLGGSGGLLNTVLGGLLGPVATPAIAGPLQGFTQGQALVAIVGEMAKGLVGGRLAVMINHANKGTPTNYGGKLYSCGFLDNSALSPGQRQDTPNCSNGAFVALGFLDLANLSDVLVRVATKLDSATSGLLAPIVGAVRDPSTVNTVLPNLLASSAPATGADTRILPPYQGREVYAEAVRYLTGRRTYNAELNSFDTLKTALTRDTSIESGRAYVSPLAAAPTCDINLVHIQLTNAREDADSDADLRATLDNPDLNGDGSLTFPEVAQAAYQRGFTDPASDRRYRIKSYFLIQNALADALALNVAGNTLFPFTDTLGLLGSTRALAKQMSPTLVVSADMAGTARPNRVDPTLPVGTPIFEPLFQPTADQNPSWLGNLKRLTLKLRADGTYQVVDQAGAPAYDATDGRLAAGISTGFGGVGDGRLVNKGGAGAKIPGFVPVTYDSRGRLTSQRGDPGRSNAANRRRLYTEQSVTNAVTGITTLRLVALDAGTNTTDDTLLNLNRVAEVIGAAGTAIQKQQQALDAVLYARGFEIGGSTTTPATATGLDQHLSCANGTTDADGSTKCVGARDWLMGAVLHSRPVAINYGSPTQPSIKVLFGATDGFLRLVDGDTGAEQWGFMPQAALAQQPALRAGLTSSGFPYGVDGPVSVVVIDRDPSGGPADGVIDAANPNDSVTAYVGLRRSGRTYYALDITDPATPRLLWRAGAEGLYRFLSARTDQTVNGATATRFSYAATATLLPSTAVGAVATNPAAAYADMGLAFAQPGVGRVRLCQAGTGGGGVGATACKLETTSRAVLLLAGGYNGRPANSATNAGKDLNNSTNTTRTPLDLRVGQDDAQGNAVYVVDAASGEILWRAEKGAFVSTAPYASAQTLYAHPMLQDGIVGDLPAIDNTGDGLTDRTYFGDLGGRVWRMDLSSPDRSQWTLTPLASLGRQATPGSFADDRRISAGVDYVPTRVNGVAYDAVVVGTGDREDPRNLVTQNYLFVLFDPDTGNGRTATDTTTADGVISTETDPRLLKPATLTTCGDGTACTPGFGSLPTGWKALLPETGQRVIERPLTTAGTVLLTSYVPGQIATEACIPAEGYSVAGAYALNNGAVNGGVLGVIRQGNSSHGGSAAGALLTGGYAGPSVGADASSRLLAGRNGAVSTTLQRNYFTSWRERRGDEP